MGIKFFDVSHHQKGMDFSGAKAAGYDGVIIRLCYGTKEDECFEGFYQQAKAFGLKVGAYIYTLADNRTSLVKECNVCRKMLAGKVLDLPLFYDKEQNWGKKGENTNLFLFFRNEMSTEQCDIGLYSSMHAFNTNFLSDEIQSTIPLWIARYNTVAPVVGRSIFAWQYTSSAIETDFYKKPLDRSIVLDNAMYENMTKGNPENEGPVKTMEELLLGILDGKYGVEERRKMLVGNTVQDLVNLYYKFSIDTIAGKYGDGLTPIAECRRLGLDPNIVQGFIAHITHET